METGHRSPVSPSLRTSSVTPLSKRSPVPLEGTSCSSGGNGLRLSCGCMGCTPVSLPVLRRRTDAFPCPQGCLSSGGKHHRLVSVFDSALLLSLWGPPVFLTRV